MSRWRRRTTESGRWWSVVRASRTVCRTSAGRRRASSRTEDTLSARTGHKQGSLLHYLPRHLHHYYLHHLQEGIAGAGCIRTLPSGRVGQSCRRWSPWRRVRLLLPCLWKGGAGHPSTRGVSGCGGRGGARGVGSRQGQGCRAGSPGVRQGDMGLQ